MLLAVALAVPVAPASAQAETVAVMPIKLLDTSGEPADQSAEHRTRLDAMAVAMSSDLRSAGLFRTVAVSLDELRLHCTPETADCILATARSKGAELLFVGVVHKSSSLIMQMWARFVDARTGKVLFSRELNFRGDTDESWQRAEAFLIDQIKAAPPRLDP